MQVGCGGTPTVKREGISDKPVSFLSGPVQANWVVPRVSRSFSSHRDVKLFYFKRWFVPVSLKQVAARQTGWYRGKCLLTSRPIRDEGFLLFRRCPT